MPRPAPCAAGLALVALLATAHLGNARAAPPGDDPRSRAQESFERAEIAWGALHFATAVSAYREAIAFDPSAPFIPRARARAADLDAHAEGGFAPLAELEDVRRDAGKSGDRTTIETLERDLARFPDGRVRSEAALVVAEAWWHRLGEPHRAVAPFEAAIADSAADRPTRALARSELVTVRRELGDLEGAREDVDRDPDLAPGTRAEVRRLVRRVHLRTASIGVLALLGVVGIASLARAARRLGGVREVQAAVVRPLAVAFALYLGGAAAVIVRMHGDGDPRPFVWLGLGVLAVDVIARTWRIGSGGGGVARMARALACAAGVLAVAFLAIERTDAGDLASFGL